MMSIISNSVMFLYLLFIGNESSLLDKIRISSFNVISILSGTGYVTDDFGLWGKFSLIFFLFFMYKKFQTNARQFRQNIMLK